MSELEYHTGPVTAVHSRAGLLVSGGRDGTVRLWDLATSREQQRWANSNTVRSVYIAPSGPKIFAGLEGKLARMSLDTVPAVMNTVELGWSCPVVCLVCSSSNPNRVCMAGFEGSSIYYKQAKVQRRNTEESVTGYARPEGLRPGGLGAGGSGTGGMGPGGSEAGRVKANEQDLLTEGVWLVQGLVTKEKESQDLSEMNMATAKKERDGLAGTGVCKDIEGSYKAEQGALLQKGRLFESEDEVNGFMESYCSSHRTAFNCSSNNKKQVRGTLAVGPSVCLSVWLAGCLAVSLLLSVQFSS